MESKFIIKENYSGRTKNLINERKELIDTFYGRVNKNKKSRAIAFKNLQIFVSSLIDLILSAFKNPITVCLLFTTVFLGTYTLCNTINENKFTYKFFSSLEKDESIPKELVVRVQKHYYNTK